MQYLHTINSEYSNFVHIESDNGHDNLHKPYLGFVVKGGAGIMCKKDLQFTLSEILDLNSSRIIGAEIKRKIQRSLYILGVYAPPESNMESYCTELYHLAALFNIFCTFGDVIIRGGLNISIYESDLAHVNKF
jgi:hypothetical protein